MGILMGIFLKKSIFSYFYQKMPIKMPISHEIIIFVKYDIWWLRPQRGLSEGDLESILSALESQKKWFKISKIC